MTIHKIITEFESRINDIYGTFIDSHFAFTITSTKIHEIIPDGDDDDLIHFGQDNPNDPSAKILYSLTLKEFKDKIIPQGQDHEIITNLCLVCIYQLWEDEYRGRIANQIGKVKSQIKNDLFGDINILRQAIIHHNGKRISKFKRLKTLTFMKDRDIVTFSKQEFHNLIASILVELESYVK